MLVNVKFFELLRCYYPSYLIHSGKYVLPWMKMVLTARGILVLLFYVNVGCLFVVLPMQASLSTAPKTLVRDALAFLCANVYSSSLGLPGLPVL